MYEHVAGSIWAKKLWFEIFRLVCDLEHSFHSAESRYKLFVCPPDPIRVNDVGILLSCSVRAAPCAASLDRVLRSESGVWIPHLA